MGPSGSEERARLCSGVASDGRVWVQSCFVPKNKAGRLSDSLNVVSDQVFPQKNIHFPDDTDKIIKAG